jgi:hypothetical protein
MLFVCGEYPTMAHGKRNKALWSDACIIYLMEAVREILRLNSKRASRLCNRWLSSSFALPILAYPHSISSAALRTSAGLYLRTQAMAMPRGNVLKASFLLTG